MKTSVLEYQSLITQIDLSIPIRKYLIYQHKITNVRSTYAQQYTTNSISYYHPLCRIILHNSILYFIPRNPIYQAMLDFSLRNILRARHNLYLISRPSVTVISQITNHVRSLCANLERRTVLFPSLLLYH